MQNYTYMVYIRIWHPDIDPVQITNSLGLEPEVAFKKGDRRSTPYGKQLKGYNEESHWQADPLNKGECIAPDNLAEDMVAEALELLQPHKAFLKKLTTEDARIQIAVNSYGDGYYTIEISPNSLMKMAELGVSFIHEVSNSR